MRPGAALFVALCLLAGGCARRVPGAELNEQDARPSLVLPQAGTVGVLPPRDLEDRVLLVNFFATWCFPCLGQLLLLSDLQKTHAAEGLQVVGVGMDLEGRKVLDPFVEQAPPGFPILEANEDIRRGETPFGRIPVLPSTFLVDRRGHIIQAWPGLPEAEVLRDAVQRALKDAK